VPRSEYHCSLSKPLEVGALYISIAGSLTRSHYQPNKLHLNTTYYFDILYLHTSTNRSEGTSVMGHPFHFSCPRIAFTFLLVLAVSLLLATTGNAAGDAQPLPKTHGGSLIQARAPSECLTPRCGPQSLCCPTGFLCHNNNCCPNNKLCGTNCCKIGTGLFGLGETFCVDQAQGLCCEFSTDFACGGKCCGKGMRCVQGQCLHPIKTLEQCKREQPNFGKVCQRDSDCPVPPVCSGLCRLGCCTKLCLS